MEFGIVDSGVLSDNFIEFYYSELQISGRVFDSSIGYTILISKRPISSYIKITTVYNHEFSAICVLNIGNIISDFPPYFTDLTLIKKNNSGFFLTG